MSRGSIAVGGMGGLMSRATGTAAARTVPYSAHRADAAAKAAIAAFPPMPTVPSQSGAPMPRDELEANKNVASWLSQTSFATREQPTGGKETPAGVEEEAPTGVPLDDIVAALRLHGEDPDRWTAPTLAKQYGISDVGALADTLAHVRTFRVVEDGLGRPRGYGLNEELPQPEVVQDLFDKPYDGDSSNGDASTPPRQGRIPPS